MNYKGLEKLGNVRLSVKGYRTNFWGSKLEHYIAPLCTEIQDFLLNQQPLPY